MHNAAYLSRASLERLGFAALGNDVQIHPTCVLVGCERMRIGSHVRIDPFCVVTMSADLVIGDRVHVSAHASLLGGGGIVIGDFACISHGTRVLSSSGDFSTGRISGPMVPPHHRHAVTTRIEIGRHAVLGTNSVILPGGGLGEGATVGALSLVKTMLEPWTVNAGVPTRVVGHRDREGVLSQERRLVEELRP